MFKKFSTKEDVSGSTSLKSSVQRTIRSSLLTQLPFLSQPAYREVAESAGAAGATASTTESAQADAEHDEDDEVKESGGGKKKGGKGKGGGKGKKGKGKGNEEAAGQTEKGKGGGGEEEEGGEGEVTVLDEIWPKKEPLGLTKCHERLSIYTLHSVPMFWNHFDGPFIPTLKLLHRYPAMLPHVRIDRGAIKFLLADCIVAIHAEGKEHACGIGKLVGSSEEIRKAGKGVAVEVLCWIGDDLWKVDTIS
ncbi:translation machinery-associated protein 20 [Saitozyma podzolica]|uniref:Translation machinery-associated protein 20 n=1 Tax=Saitozyma podzolica TaxID=1890683 RepID=A0A427Y369_9TREE|nr:translation machinery-associated protein 20 [Saitozyma podzolica]